MFGKIAGLVGSIKGKVGDTFLILIMGFISDALLALEKQEKSEKVDAIFDSVVYALLRFEFILRAEAAKSATQLDDKLVDELMEACQQIMAEGGIELPPSA